MNIVKENIHRAESHRATGSSLRKYQIAAILARRYGYSSYLEVCTPSTGRTFGKVDHIRLRRRTRLMYRRPDDFTDGDPIHLATASESSEELFAEIIAAGDRFDMVFIDPWHTYAASLRDIVFALQVVKPEGLVMVHDCNPDSIDTVSPSFQPGEWCGVTFAAFLDVVLFNSDLHYGVIDTDFGCGIISKLTRPELFNRPRDETLAWRWKTLPLDRKYTFLEQYRSELLHLMTEDEFRGRQAA